MKLYDARHAPNPRRVRWFMAEKGIDDIEVIQIDLMGGAHRAPDYVAKVGVPIIPALELDDGTVLTESLAICRYLESLYPEPNLFGREAKEAAIIEMWTRRAEMALAIPLMMAVRHSHPALAPLEAHQTPEVAAFYRGAAERALPLFDRRLGESEYLAGDRLSIADIVAAVGLDFGRILKFRVPEDYPHLRRWQAAMNARPAAQAGT